MPYQVFLDEAKQPQAQIEQMNIGFHRKEAKQTDLLEFISKQEVSRKVTVFKLQCFQFQNSDFSFCYYGICRG